MKNDDLKPCPFCGGSAEVRRYGNPRQSCIVNCEDCGACLESNEVGAGDSWNQRPPENFETLALHLYETRKASREAKAAQREAAGRLGDCAGYPNYDPCYVRYDKLSDYCDVCREKQPLWEARVDAGKAAGNALRAITSAAKKIQS